MHWMRFKPFFRKRAALGRRLRPLFLHLFQRLFERLWLRPCLRRLFGLLFLGALAGVGCLATAEAGAKSEKASDVDADALCRGADVFSAKLITKLCWDCVLPIRVAGVSISGAGEDDRVPAEAADASLCMCDDKLGVPHPGVLTQFWEPYRMVEWQRIPGCMAALDGARFPFRRTFLGGHGALAQEDAEGNTFKHYHYYAFPVMEMLGLFVPADCNPDYYVDFDIVFLSEMDPTWNDDVLAYFAMPENALLGSDLAAAACIPDAVSASLAQKPLQPLFWCAGSWGLLYPASGNVTASDAVSATALFSARMLNVMHRRGFVHRTVGEDAMCSGVVDPTLPKYMYRFSMFSPVAHTDDTFVLGESALRWGLGRLIPATGEDQIYVIWRWLDCCQTKSEAP